MNKDIEYELFVKEIYEALHKADNVENISIQHNIELVGLTGCKHQIDIYWHFILAGVEYQVAIECKNYSGKVPIGKIRDFYSVLDDIGNINGIFVSRNGFQQGAVNYAKQKRIKLLEIRPPSAIDWEGRTRHLTTELHMYCKNIKRCIIEEDSDGGTNNSLISSYFNSSIMSDQVFIDDLDSGIKISLCELHNKLPCSEVGIDFKYIYEYQNAYIYHSSSPKFKVKRIIIEYDVNCPTETIELNGDKTAKAIIKDITNGSEQLIDIFGNINTRQQI